MSNFRLPGPTPLPPDVLNAVSWQMINHRGQEYEVMQLRITENLRHFFQTEHDVFLFTASGTGGFDAAISNFFSTDDTVVSFTCGVFGDRFADCARSYKTRVIQRSFSPGTAIEPEVVERILSEHKKVTGVLLTHNETSTGVLNDIKTLSRFVNNHPAKPLLIVDSISGLGAVDLPMDELGIDVLITASQKAWMSPPGICMVAVSPKAWKMYKTSNLPKYYFDISLMKKFAEKNQTPATPAVSVLYGLDAALIRMKKEGRSKIFARHLALRDSFRLGIRSIGLDLLVDDVHASPTVTAVRVPARLDAHEWMKRLRDQYDTIVAGGIGELKGKIIRVAHMGYASKKDIVQTLTSIKASLETV